MKIQINPPMLQSLVLKNRIKKLTNTIEECYDILNSNGLKSDVFNKKL